MQAHQQTLVVLLWWCRYKRALEAHPSGPPEIRLGIAACFFKAGYSDKAQVAYERVLELDPGSADALLGLATVKLASSNVQQVGASVCDEEIQFDKKHGNKD
jgi:Tfp pilus assembly protein PilF